MEEALIGTQTGGVQSYEALAEQLSTSNVYTPRIVSTVQSVSPGYMHLSLKYKMIL